MIDVELKICYVRSDVAVDSLSVKVANKMNPPIFVYEPADLCVFSTKEKEESYLEAIDVNNGIYTELYDSMGLRLKVSTTPDNDVIIASTEPPEIDTEALRKLLQRFLTGTKGNSSEWLDTATLQELVLKSLEYKTW